MKNPDAVYAADRSVGHWRFWQAILAEVRADEETQVEPCTPEPAKVEGVPQDASPETSALERSLRAQIAGTSEEPHAT